MKSLWSPCEPPWRITIKWWSILSPADPRHQLQLVRLVLFRQGHLFGHLHRWFLWGLSWWNHDLFSWWFWDSIENMVISMGDVVGFHDFHGILALLWHDIKWNLSLGISDFT
jgi:glycogen synthase